MKASHWIALALALMPATGRAQQVAVDARWIEAHERFLAGDALRGRGSATPDEAIAAAYVAAQFAGYGLKPAPGATSHVQTAPVIRRLAIGPIALSADGAPIAGAQVLRAANAEAAGTVAAFADPKLPPPVADILVYTGTSGGMRAAIGVATAVKAKLLLVPERPGSAPDTAPAPTPAAPRLLGMALADGPVQGMTVVSLPAATLAKIATAKTASFALPMREERTVTSNAIGYLPGRDAKAGTLLITAHLDHLGVLPDGTVMPGANDDASGTVGVLELARTLAAGPAPKRAILFVAYGAEEAGGLGSRYFAAHPPIPLTDVVANIEFEMIGAQDPKLPAGALMMTGFERSTLGAMLRAQGANIAPDPYPDEHFFERSDNYSLALQGVVAHTLSGWATVPTYHSPKDTADAIDYGYMAKAVQALSVAVRGLADGDQAPQWQPGGRPTR